MTENLETSITNFMIDLHEFIDWTKHWGSPRTAREETTYFELQGKILQEKVGLKPFVHQLRVTLEGFLEDYRKELHAKEKIGNEFLEKSSKIIDLAEACHDSLSSEDKELHDSITKMIESAMSHLKADSSSK